MDKLNPRGARGVGKGEGGGGGGIPDENDGVLVVPIKGRNMYIGAEIYNDHG